MLACFERSAKIAAAAFPASPTTTEVYDLVGFTGVIMVEIF